MWNFRVLHGSFQVQALFRQYFCSGFSAIESWSWRMWKLRVWQRNRTHHDASWCFQGTPVVTGYHVSHISVNINQIGYIYIYLFFSLVMSNAPCIHWFFSVRSILDLWSSWFPCPKMKHSGHSVHPWKVRSWVKSFLVRLSLMRSRPPSIWKHVSGMDLWPMWMARMAKGKFGVSCLSVHAARYCDILFVPSSRKFCDSKYVQYVKYDSIGQWCQRFVTFNHLALCHS